MVKERKDFVNIQYESKAHSQSYFTGVLEETHNYLRKTAAPPAEFPHPTSLYTSCLGSLVFTGERCCISVQLVPSKRRSPY